MNEESDSVIVQPTRHSHATTFQTEIEPASSSGHSSDSEPSWTIPDLVEQLRQQPGTEIGPVLTEIIQLTKDREERHIKELISCGVLPLLLAILSDDKTHELETRIRIAAAICNLSQTQNSQRSFASCFAVHILIDFVIGKHQALTGASALILKSMLKSEFLISTMKENGVPLVLIRAVLLCNDAEISDIVVDVLIRMTMIDALKEYMLEHRAVQICVYLLHVLACRHYHLVSRDGAETPDHSQPSFISQSTRDILILYLSPSRDRKTEGCRDWEDRLKKETILGKSEDEGNFSQAQVIHVSLLLEFLSWVLLSSPDACNQFMALPFALDVLQYWMQNGNPLMKQSGLSSTSVLLRNGHRAFVTLRDIINNILGILIDHNRHSGISRIQYKVIAIETLNELCIFGGDNMCLATSAAGVLKPMLELLEVEDHQLQHLTLRAMNTICSHFHPVSTLVSIDGIPCLCEFLEKGLKEIRGPIETEKKGPLARMGIRNPLRKQVETPDVESNLERGHGDDYSRVRCLDYCIALLRSITACQSTDWVPILKHCRIIQLSLDALSQNHTTTTKKQALGILANLILMKNSNVVADIASESGCGLLLELLIQNQRSQDQDSVHWVAWTKFILHEIAQEPQLMKTLNQALRVHYGQEVGSSKNNLSRMFIPNRGHLNLEWFSNSI